MKNRMIKATCNHCGWYDSIPCDVESDDMVFTNLWHGVDIKGKGHPFDGTISEYFPEQRDQRPTRRGG